MLKVLIYAGGVITGAGLLVAAQWYATRAAKIARNQAYRDYTTRQKDVDQAYEKGYANGRRDYRTRSDAERFAEAWEGRRAQFTAR